MRARDFNFITVTMPHKELVQPFCDDLTPEAKAIGSVNYIYNDDGRLLGCNFDGIGAFNEIEKLTSVKQKQVLVIGTGGAGKAAIFEAKKRGAFVFCTNRTKKTGMIVAKDLGVKFLESPAIPFDIVVNATSIGMDPSDERLVCASFDVYKNAAVLDMASRSGDCLLKREVIKARCRYISGKEMFLNLTESALQEFFIKDRIKV